MDAGFSSVPGTMFLVFSLIGFVCFCLAASGTYFLNDARDAEADRRHPTKQARPVASGIVPVRTGPPAV